MRRAKPYLYLLSVVWVLPVVVFGIGYTVLDKTENCNGGMVCWSDADNFAIVMLIMVAPTATIAGLVGVTAIAAVQFWKARAANMGRSTGFEPAVPEGGRDTTS